MRKVAPFALALVALAAAAGAENRALVVGVGKYQHPGADLPGIDLDVKNMREAAKGMGFTDAQIKSLLDQQATLAGIRGAFKSWLVDGAGPQDKVLFYFSGHGTQIKDTNGDEADGTDEVFLPHDFRVANQTIEGSFVDDEFGALIDQLKTRNAYVYIDSCHSGTVTRAVGVSEEYVPKFFGYEGMPKGDGRLEGDALIQGKGEADESHVLMTAATEKQQAIATKAGSLFTLGVLDAVQKAQSSRALTPRQMRDSSEKFIVTQLSSNPSRVHNPTLYGNQRLASSNIFGAASGSTGPGVVGGVVGGGGSHGAVWADLERRVSASSYPVRVSARQQTYRENDNLVIDVDVNEPGYVNVINVGSGDGSSTVLFPNQFQRDNQVQAGRLTIPGTGAGFNLPAGLPGGRSEQQALIVVIHSKDRLNLYESAGKAGELFAELDADEATRAFSVAGAPTAGGRKAYGAGKAVVTIRK